MNPPNDEARALLARPEVDYHDLPARDKVTLYDGVGTLTPAGALVEVWRSKETDGLHIRLRRPLDDGTQSVLRFGLTRDAAASSPSIPKAIGQRARRPAKRKSGERRK